MAVAMEQGLARELGELRVGTELLLEELAQQERLFA
jgi:hypothetical protein